MRPQNLPKASTLKPVLQRVSNPPIIPIPQRRAGNSIPHSHTKTRRSWAANKGRYDLPVNVIGGAAFLPAPEVKPGDKRRPHGFKLKGVKMTVRDLRSVDKAGGIEGLLLGRPASKLDAFGKELRADLFKELHFIRHMTQMTEEMKQKAVEEEALALEAPETESPETGRPETPTQ